MSGLSKNYFYQVPQHAELACRMAYQTWGEPASPHLIVCVHGLTRQSHDFDVLAPQLAAQGAYVIATDVVGRGDSDWLADPMHYQVPTYCAHHLGLLQSLMAAQAYQRVDWVGTSMGGLIGMGVASVFPIRKLVLNDVGPQLNPAAIHRISDYVGKYMEFADEASAIAHLAAIHQGFGAHSESEWRALCLPMFRPLATGGLRLHYDPKIAAPFAFANLESAAQGEALLWQIFTGLKSELLLLRGAESDLLKPEAVTAMLRAQPTIQVVEFAGVGHAPSLVRSEQTQIVCDFLDAS